MIKEILQPHIEKLNDRDRLVIMDKDKQKELVTLYKEGEKLYEYINIFAFHEIEDVDEEYSLSIIDWNNVSFVNMSFYVWCMYKKQQNYIYFHESANSLSKTNARHILNEIKDNQGCLVTFDSDKDRTKKGVVLITVVASDEDYYYVTYDEAEDKFILTTCVAACRVIDRDYQPKVGGMYIANKLYDAFDFEGNTDAIVYWGIYEKKK